MIVEMIVNPLIAISIIGAVVPVMVRWWPSSEPCLLARDVLCWLQYYNTGIIRAIIQNIGEIFQKHKNGPFRDLNPGPPAPKAGIIPLDQTDFDVNLIT